MPYGTFRDQIIYPDSMSGMRAKGVRDGHLVKFLQLVDLDWMVNSENDAGAQSSSSTLLLPGTTDKGLGSFEQVCISDSEGRQEEEKELRTLGQKRSWDAVDNWMDVLSGGQKQRLAMARMFYHRPQFAILDECTSAVSVDVEGNIYRYCRSTGITLFTVTHRKSLWDFHDFVLHMDGRGSYSMKKIDHDENAEFGS